MKPYIPTLLSYNSSPIRPNKCRSLRCNGYSLESGNPLRQKTAQQHKLPYISLYSLDMKYGMPHLQYAYSFGLCWQVWSSYQLDVCNICAIVLLF